MSSDLTENNFITEYDIFKEHKDSNESIDKLDSKMKGKLIKSIYMECISKNYNGIDSIISKKYTMEDIVRDREERMSRQEWLIRDYLSPLISIRVNYPGLNKNNCASFIIMKVFSALVIDKFKDKIMYKDLQATAEGPVLTLIINEDVYKIKKLAINVEDNHFLGRFVDIDVFGNNEVELSRRELGLESRRCYICGQEAYNCAGSGKYDIDEIKEYIENKLEEYLKNKLS